MITATPTNIAEEADRIKVYVLFSNGKEEAFTFMPEVTIAEIRTAVKARLGVFNSTVNKVDTLKQYIGKEIS